MINDTLNDDTSKAGKTNVSDARCEAADEGGTRGQPRERVLVPSKPKKAVRLCLQIRRSGGILHAAEKWFVKMGVWYYRTIDLSATVCD